MGRQDDLAATFGTTSDPLAEFNEGFMGFDWSPMDEYFSDEIETRDISEQTKYGYRLAIDQFEEWLAEVYPDRHPACVNTDIALAFSRHLRDDRENTRETLMRKMYVLEQAYEYFAREPDFPHGGSIDEDGVANLYNPFKTAKSRVQVDERANKEPPRVTVEEVREKLRGCPHIRERLIMLMQFKLGLRASELCNIRLPEFSIDSELLREHYPEMGTHPHIEGRANVVYIPDNNHRSGNKSRRARLLPLDEEVRLALLSYLKIRPDVESDRLLLSGNTATPMEKEGVLYVWKKYWRPEYDETEHHAAIGSHFGRHFFTTYWEKQGLSVPQIKYLRGDKLGNKDDYRGAISTYVHTYFEDIAPVYRDRIYQLT